MTTTDTYTTPVAPHADFVNLPGCTITDNVTYLKAEYQVRVGVNATTDGISYTCTGPAENIAAVRALYSE
jgi:hypothetical protein